MSVPDHYRNVSLMLSRVMNDVGVNEECVTRWRRTNMLWENILTLRITSFRAPTTVYLFGSQTERSTTRGLKSDSDILATLDNRHVIQDWKDWSLGIDHFMMIQDETTFPGYCKLQVLRFDKPIEFERHVYDEKRRIILKNDIFCSYEDGAERHGPALNCSELIKRGIDNDLVYAFYCPTWPKHYKQWSLRREAYDWPTPEMVEYMKTSGCFLVAVGHRCSESQETEWRISTSLAERCLMFNLNITQIRCYVLLKMITKTFIQPFVPDVISSYICKTLLFHTLERTNRDFWRERNLLACVTRVLSSLYLAVYNMDCPNYFHESANLLLGKLDQVGTREKLLVLLRKLLHSQGRFLLQIEFDDISTRIMKYFANTVRCQCENTNPRILHFFYSYLLACGTISDAMHRIFTDTESDATKRRDLLSMTLDYSRKGYIQYRAASMLFPFLCSHIATVDTSERIRRGQNVSPRALLLYKFSLDFDAASSRLRFASFLYCSGQYERSLLVLQKVEQRMNSVAFHLCFCSGEYKLHCVNPEFVIRERSKPFPTTSNIGLCVMFSRSESQCCPLEMHFEYFRSTDGEILQRRRDFSFDKWMDRAVLDCLPFLYYLQYIAARHLGQRDLQYRALHKLFESAFGEEPLSHRETAFNVLGQCMEHENRFDKALLCYMMSFRHRPRNNAVRWLFVRLIYIVNQRCQ